MTIGGDGWNSQEIWQFGWRFDRATIPTSAETDISNAVQTWWGQYGPSEYVRLTHWKWALQGTDGDYPAGHVPFEHVYVPALAGNSTNDGAQPQDTIVLSLRTSRPRGRGHAGRIYPPVRPVNINASGLIGSVTSLLQSFVTLVTAIQNAVDAPLVVGSELAGTLRPVTMLRMGQVVDTQRRRRNALPEMYTDLPISGPTQQVIPGPATTGAGQNDWWIPTEPASRPSSSFKALLPCYVEAVPVLSQYAILLRPGDTGVYPACTSDGFHTMHVGPGLTDEQIATESFPDAWTRYFA
jgi:hypothetical protein